MRLRGRRVVVRADLPGERIGAIVIPERYRSQPLTGEVVLVGHQVTTVHAGERVMWGHYAWSRFNAHGYGFPYMLVKEDDLICVLS